MTQDTPLHPFDRPSAAVLRARGSLKWTGIDAEIAAWVAESDFGTAPAVTAALRDAVETGRTGYLTPALRRDLGEACSGWQRSRYGWDVSPDRVHPVGDVLEALRVTVAHLSRPGSPLIVPTPAYMPFVHAPRVWGREILPVPMAQDAGRSTLDLDAVDRAFEAGGHLLVLTNPHNPTGRVHTRAELSALADVVAGHGGRVFADEIHAPLVYAGGQHISYASLSTATAAHTVTATSASKAWNVAGLKCAQILLSNHDDAVRWAPIDQVVTTGASTLGAVANIAAYRHGGPWLEEVVSYLDGNRRAFAAVMDDLAPSVPHLPPEGTYLAWIDLRDALTAFPDAPGAGDVARWLLERTGVSVVDGAACGSAGAGFVRLNLAMPRPMVVEAGRRIAACLDAG